MFLQKITNQLVKPGSHWWDKHKHKREAYTHRNGLIRGWLILCARIPGVCASTCAYLTNLCEPGLKCNKTEITWAELKHQQEKITQNWNNITHLFGWCEIAQYSGLPPHTVFGFASPLASPSINWKVDNNANSSFPWYWGIYEMWTWRKYNMHVIGTWKRSLVLLSQWTWKLILFSC